jgi:hypothetical protein
LLVAISGAGGGRCTELMVNLGLRPSAAEEQMTTTTEISLTNPLKSQ